MTPRGQGDSGVVLVAEDDPFYRKILAKRLIAGGHEVVLTADGREAWNEIRRSPPDVLLSDWMMPYMDGVELCRAVKSDPKLRSVYCILLTAKDHVDDKIEALDIGADDYLVKPCDDRELLARVRTGLRAHRRTARLEKESITDTLTGLHNRRYLGRRLAEEVVRVGRKGTPLALVLVDLDHFKTVNDRFGHPIGDEVLSAVGEILRNRVRRGEVAARIGGDEFAVLLPDTDLEGARAFASWVEEALVRLRLARPECADLEMGGSAGCAVLPEGGDASRLMKDADDALYARKKQRRVLS